MFNSSHTLASAVTGSNSASPLPTESETQEEAGIHFPTSGRIRAFPYKPIPEPGSLTDFVEETGINAILIEALQKLYAESHKPENPIEWFRLYFKYHSTDTTEEMKELEGLLKSELTDLERKLLDAIDLESQNQAIIKKLEHEIKKFKLAGAKDIQHEDFVNYINHPDDYHYRIKPDPNYQASMTDMLLSYDDMPSTSASTTKLKDVFGDFVPYDPILFFPESEEIPGQLSVNDAIYQDYPETYFPEFVNRPQSAMTDDGMDESEFGHEAEETEYDAGSEGGDSEESRHSRTSRLPTPNSAVHHSIYHNFNPLQRLLAPATTPVTAMHHPSISPYKPPTPGNAHHHSISPAEAMQRPQTPGNATHHHSISPHLMDHAHKAPTTSDGTHHANTNNHHNSHNQPPPLTNANRHHSISPHADQAHKPTPR